jgi:NAD(P)-dependent dehydrogenase (short-subunit alcohol dehydrogenase family)
LHEFGTSAVKASSGTRNRFEGSSVIVTAAAQGLGRGTAAAFLAEGTNVLLCDVNAAKVEQAAEELGRDAAGTAVAAPCDVSRTEDMRAVIDRAVAEWISRSHG